MMGFKKISLILSLFFSVSSYGNQSKYTTPVHYKYDQIVLTSYQSYSTVLLPKYCKKLDKNNSRLVSYDCYGILLKKVRGKKINGPSQDFGDLLLPGVATTASGVEYIMECLRSALSRKMVSEVWLKNYRSELTEFRVMNRSLELSKYTKKTSDRSEIKLAGAIIELIENKKTPHNMTLHLGWGLGL